ncbi:DnaD domain-containing protein [Planococcus rifietoensis]|uniref:DnaD domain-containing protein n=1 Tax=Planococcus rifietoensis TaxID=200991 RepID=UPI0009F8A074|nr:DnaD domain protein [Planococcus rifietoensis]
MSKYRQVQVGYWQDGFVLDLTPEEKYFYIYLMTNSKASQIGIYELPKRIIETETGYNRETVEKLLQRFVDYGKIDYNDDTKEIMLLNWARHNWNNSPKVVARVEEELRSVKHIPFASNYLDIANAIKADTVSIQYPYSTDSLCKQEIRDKEKDKDKEKEKEQHHQGPDLKPVVADAGKAFRFYEQNISHLVPHIAERISIMIDESSEELVHEALKRSVEANARNKMNFADAILKTWDAQRITTLAGVLAADETFERNKQDQHSASLKGDKRNEKNGRYPGRTSGKSAEDVLAAAKRDRAAWGG